MANIKPVSSGIDLSNLSTAQLEALAVEAKAKALELSAKEKEIAVAALKKTDDFINKKKEWLALNKHAKKLANAKTFDIVLPIRFTMTTELYQLCEIFKCASEDLVEEDIFHHEFFAKLTKDHNLNKAQTKILNQVLEDYTTNACEDIHELVPQEIANLYAEFSSKLKDFVLQAIKSGLTAEDLE
jgi:hypothetical protein